MPTQTVPITSPIKGVVRAIPREGQPAETCFDAQNCLPYDRYGRKRLAQRTGLAKEYPNQMSDNFVQGMIEAPNIIYPPGTLDEDIPIIQNLADPFQFAGPTNIGPITATMPTAGATTLYEWTFNITYSFTASPTLPDPDWSDDGDVVIYFYWPLGSGMDDDLILQISLGCSVGWNGGGDPNGVEANMHLISGDAMNNGTWNDVIPESMAPVYGTSVASSGDVTTSFSVACTITINANGTITLTMDPVSGRSPAVGSSPITQTEFPELALLGIFFFDSQFSVGSTGISTITITD